MTRGLLERAASMLEKQAEMVFASFTVQGRWPRTSRHGRTEHMELLRTAKQLRRLAELFK